MSGQSWDPKNTLVVSPSVQPQSIAVGVVNGVGLDAVNISELGAGLLVGALTGASTVDCKVQESTLLASGYQDLVPPVAFTQVVAANPSPAPVINFKRTLRFVRLVVTVGGTAALVAAEIFGQKKVY